MSDLFIGEIFLMGSNFAPRGSSYCLGQILSVSQNSTLYSLLGITYGGNGRYTFQLPHIGARTPIGSGQGLGLTNYPLGNQGGQEAVTLTSNQLPSHDHGVTVQVGDGPPNSADPNNDYLSNLPAAATLYSQTGDGTTFTWGQSEQSGANMAHNNMQPYLAVNYCIQLQGIYPSRN